MKIKRLYHFQCSTKQSPAPTSGAGSCEINTTKGEHKEMKHFFKKALSLALAVLFTLGAVSVTAFVGLLPAAAEGESTLGAAAACSGHTLGTFNNVPACVNADGELHICGNNFPDNNFRNYVSNKRFDGNDNGYFSVYESEAIKTIGCPASKITSLNGIEFFCNLSYLDCSGNQLTTLDISKNTALSHLNCTGNKLTTLDVSNNVEMTILECGNNKLSILNTKNNSKLTKLSCDDNELTALDVSNNTKLTSLVCYENQLTTLDVAKNIELEYLDCRYNQLASLDVSNKVKLTYLDCSQNQLDTLNVHNNTKLTTLYCSSNQLIALDTNDNAGLTTLYCSNNQLTTLNVGNNTKLTTLRCDDNKLTTLNVNNAASLTTLYCPYNQLTMLDFNNNTELTELYCFQNRLASLDVSNNAKLTSLLCDDNKLTTLNVSNNTKLTSLICGFNQLTSLDVSNNTELTILNCAHTKLVTLDVSNNIDLTSLDCCCNELTTLDVSNNTKLTRLCCTNNRLTTLDLSKCAKLNEIYCRDQGIFIAVADLMAFDMHKILSDEELKHVSVDSYYGTYDPTTGIIVFNAKYKSFWYFYDIGKDGKTMGVYVTLKMHEHTYGDYVSNGDGTHTRHCTFEGCTDTETENCSGGTATCKDKAVCEICGEEYGELNPENHTGKEVWDQTETKHTKKWSCCGKITVAEADHEFENGVCTVCAYPCAHKDDNADHKCDLCGMTVSEHTDVNTDHKCDICGVTVSDHTDVNNDHKCDICGETISEHIDSNNNHLCDICGEAVSDHSDENHDHICDICGETISTHTGGTATCKDKAVCEICGEAYGELDANNHTGGTHIEHEKAATCTEKGYTGDTYCSGCNEKIADGSEIPTKPHTPGEKWVIENGKKVKKCTECGAIAETAPRMPGDVDGDGEITMLDCLYLKRYILGTFSGEIVLENADVDGNGRIDATDYLYLKRGYLGTFDLSKFA